MCPELFRESLPGGTFFIITPGAGKWENLVAPLFFCLVEGLIGGLEQVLFTGGVLREDGQADASAPCG